MSSKVYESSQILSIPFSLIKRPIYPIFILLKSIGILSILIVLEKQGIEITFLFKTSLISSALYCAQAITTVAFCNVLKYCLVQVF